MGFVEGQDPRDVEVMWDMMWRATINYGRKGLPIQALSAVDLALWDLLGKLRNEPVYALLGGEVDGSRQRAIALAPRISGSGRAVPNSSVSSGAPCANVHTL